MQKFLVDGVEIAARVLGTGQPVVLLHGFPLSHEMWSEQLEVLGRHYQVIAPDLRGFGMSQVTIGTVTMERMADDVAGLLDALRIEDPVVLCGLSMGGYVAWPFLRKYRSRVRALIACDTRAVADTPEGVANRHRLAQMILENGSEVAATAMLPNLLAASTGEQQQQVVEQLRQLVAANHPEGLAAALRGMAERPDVREWLPQIDVPTLLLVGEHDRVSTVDEMREMAGRIPQARLAVIPHAGHLAPLENPADANLCLLEFLQSIAGA